MPAARTRRPGRPAWVVGLFVIGGVVLVGTAIGAVHLLRGGQIVVPFTDPPQVIALEQKEKPKPWSPPKGKVGVPLAARKIAAYTMITRDDLWDVKASRPKMLYLDPEAVNPVMITDAAKIVGRVLAHEKGAGYVFSESDFLPAGTRPGVVAGIPAGMRAMRIELTQVEGLFGLSPGDRFDIVSTVAVSGDPAKDLKRLGGAYAERVSMEAQLGGLGKQAIVKVVVQNGIVVSPVQTREIPITASSTRGRSTAAKPIQEVVIAIHPEEVGPLSEAMAIEAELSVIPRSGRPDDDMTSVTPDHRPKSPFGGTTADGKNEGVVIVEVIGKDRELIPVPPAPETPEEK